jgi:hypothetical protein
MVVRMVVMVVMMVSKHIVGIVMLLDHKGKGSKKSEGRGRSKGEGRGKGYGKGSDTGKGKSKGKCKCKGKSKGKKKCKAKGKGKGKGKYKGRGKGHREARLPPHPRSNPLPLLSTTGTTGTTGTSGTIETPGTTGTSGSSRAPRRIGMSLSASSPPSSEMCHPPLSRHVLVLLHFSLFQIHFPGKATNLPGTAQPIVASLLIFLSLFNVSKCAHRYLGGGSLDPGAWKDVRERSGEVLNTCFTVL